MCVFFSILIKFKHQPIHQHTYINRAQILNIANDEHHQQYFFVVSVFCWVFFGFYIIFTLRKHRKPPFFLLLCNTIKGINWKCAKISSTHTHSHITAVWRSVCNIYLCVMFCSLPFFRYTLDVDVLLMDMNEIGTIYKLNNKRKTQGLSSSASLTDLLRCALWVWMNACV